MYAFLEYRVRDFMSERGTVLRCHDTLAEAERLFERSGADLLPVVEGSRLLGVVSSFDFLRAFTFGRESLVPRYDDILGREVSTVMNRQPVVVGPDSPLTRVLEAMVTTRCKTFPVVGDGVLLGVISREDVVRARRPGGVARGGEPVR